MAVHGKGTYFGLDNAGGSLQDLSAYIRKIDTPFSVDKHDTTTFGANSKTFDPGLKDGTISVEGIWNATIETHMTGLLGLSSTSTFAVGPDGSSAGKPKRTGECRLVGYKPPSSVSDINTFTAEFQISGDVSFTTF